MARALPIDWRPDTRKLRAFGWIALCVLAALGAALWCSLGGLARALGPAREPVAVGMFALAAVSAAFSLLYPRGNRPLYLLLTVLAYPLGWVLSYALLALIFFCVFTPIGWTLRALGKDPLQRGFDRTRGSYWTTPRQPRDKASYFRLF